MQPVGRLFGVPLALGLCAAAAFAERPAPPAAQARPRLGCPAEMAKVGGFCIDRWEASLVDRTSGRPLSPFYPPHPRLLARIVSVWEVERELLGDESARAMPLPQVPSWQWGGGFVPKAVSRPGVVPHGYLSYYQAKRACDNAGKRLCTEQEWVTACRGARDRKFPYGSHYVNARCNVFRALHPAAVLHGHASVGHTDPRLNLVVEAGRDPLLRLTGATRSCVSRFGDQQIFDMVGNLDEWLADPSGVFVGGFYARNTKQGCEAKIKGHAPAYYDYSTGTRCCRAPR